MKLFKTKKTFFSFFILFLVLINFSFPKKAEAILPVTVDGILDPEAVLFFQEYHLNTLRDSAFQAKQVATPSIWDMLRKGAVEPALEALGKVFATNLVEQISNATIDWINHDFKGQPAFISNFSKFTQQTTNNAIGDFIEHEPSLAFLCSPFKIDVIESLRLKINLPTFQRRITCTFDQVKANALNAVNNPSIAWSAWLDITNDPQNTPFGASIIAQNEINLRTKNKTDNLEKSLLFGQGALSYKECTHTLYSHGSEVNKSVTTGFDAGDDETVGVVGDDTGFNGSVTKCEVKTPGAVVTSMLGFTATTDQRTDELRKALSNGIDGVLSALLNKAAQFAIGKIRNGILTATSNFSSDYQSTLHNIQNNYNNGGATTADYCDVNTFGADYCKGFSTTTITQPDNGTQGGGVANNLEEERTLVLNNINDQLTIETDLRSNLSTTFNTLTNANDSTKGFKAANSCNYTISPITANAIEGNVISNINGVVNDSYRDSNVALLTWNLQTITTNLSRIGDYIDLLVASRDAANHATTLSDLTNITTNLNSTTFDTSTQSSLDSSTRTWLNGWASTYTSNACPIDLSNI